MSERPQRGDIWVHYKGTHYIVLGVGLDANNTRVRDDGLDVSVVVYRRLDHVEIFVRDEVEFLEEVDGVPRFRLVYRPPTPAWVSP